MLCSDNTPASWASRLAGCAISWPLLRCYYLIMYALLPLILYVSDRLQRTGIPYGLRTLEDYNVHVSSELHIKELSEAPEDELSLHAIAKDVSARRLFHTRYCAQK